MNAAIIHSNTDIKEEIQAMLADCKTQQNEFDENVLRLVTPGSDCMKNKEYLELVRNKIKVDQISLILTK